MVNLYSFIKQEKAFNKLEVNDLLFAEYTCIQEETKFGIWSDSNYFAFITSGKKMWRTIYNNYEVVQGDVLFIKKGANLTHQFFDDEFCAIFIFIPDQFIKSFLKKNPQFLDVSQKSIDHQDAVLRLASNQLLKNYSNSIVSYLSMDQKPALELLQLKFEELLVSICTSTDQQDICDYFISLCQDKHYQLSRVMEENFAYNLKIEDFAQLCNMSISTFKIAFKDYYNATPGAWIKKRRLKLATHHLLQTNLNINQISFECGFEAPSHFIRVFKQEFKITPLQFRKSNSK